MNHYDRQCSKLDFPQFIFNLRDFPNNFNLLIDDLEAFSCKPTYPWAQWFYYQIILKHNLNAKGSACEYGVALGGMSLFLSRVFDGTVYAFDTFAGAPHGSGLKEQPYYKEGDYSSVVSTFESRISQKAKEINVDKKLRLIKGDFSTIDQSEQINSPLSFVHIDCNLYDSIYASLTQVYDKVIDGGVIAIDEFFHHSSGVRRATTDFFRERNITPVFYPIFPYSVVLIKGEKPKGMVPSISGDYFRFDYLKDHFFLKKLELNYKKLKVLGNAEEASFPFTLLKTLSREMNSHDIHLYLWLMQNFWNTFYQTKESTESREIISK